MLIWRWLAFDVFNVLVALFFVPFVVSNLTISARVHFCRSRRFFLLRLVQALLQVDTSKQDLFILDEDASMRQRWMLHRSYICCLSIHGMAHWDILEMNVSQIRGEFVTERHPISCEWIMNAENYPELSLMGATFLPKGQPLVWLGSLQYVLRTWQWHIHM